MKETILPHCTALQTVATYRGTWIVAILTILINVRLGITKDDTLKKTKNQFNRILQY